MKANYKYCPHLGEIIKERQACVRVSHETLGVSVYNDAQVLPFVSWNEGLGGVCDKDNQFIKQSAWNEDYEYMPLSATTDLMSINGEYIFIGVLHNCWGHAVTDNLKKVWALRNEPYLKMPICYTTIGNESLSPHVKELLELAGVNMDLAHHITKPTKINRLHIPDNSFTFYAPNHLFYKTIQEMASKIQASESCGKIYLSRVHWQSDLKRDCGETEMEEIFTSHGYNIIYPEQLSVKDQIKMYLSCEEMVATEGSVALNSIFMSGNSRLVVLKKADYVNKYQNAINALFDLDITYVESHHSSKADKKEPWHGPFYIYPTNRLRGYLNDGYYRWTYRPYFMRLSWYRYMRFIPRAINFIKRRFKNK